MILKRQKLYSALDPEIIKQFLGRLSGFVHKAKSLHWAADGKDIHEYLDEIWEATYKFQDTVAEGYMGIDGKIDSNIPFLMPNDSNTPEKFIKELEFQVIDYYRLFDDDPKYSGLRGEFESFIQTIEKYKYLFGLCEEKEFSEKEGKGKEAAKTGVVLAGSGALIYGGKKLKKSGHKLETEAGNIEKHSAGISKAIERQKVNVGKLKAEKKRFDIEAYDQIFGKGSHAKRKVTKTAVPGGGTMTNILQFRDSKIENKLEAAEKEITKLKDKKDILDKLGKKKAIEGAKKTMKGKGLIIAGATLPAAYVIHRIKNKKKD